MTRTEIINFLKEHNIDVDSAYEQLRYATQKCTGVKTKIKVGA